jgi:phage tail protein X
VTELRETVWIEDCTLANLIWRKLGKQPDGFLEKVIERNPGLSADQYIPVGTEIMFPVSEIAETSAAADVVRLWD